MAHTPGPWEVNLGTEIFKQTERGNLLVARVSTFYVGPFRGQEHANACLIAAAPDLLAACELAKELLDALRLDSGIGKVLHDYERDAFKHTDEKLTAAIAKAEGTSDV